MTNRLALVALLAAPALIIALAALWPATPDAERAGPVDPPVRNVAPAPPISPRPAPRVHAAEEETQPAESTPLRHDADPSRASVRGRIVYATAAHPELARVALVPSAPGAPADPERLATAAMGSWLDGRTSFTFGSVPPGRYLLGVSFLDGTVGASQTVDVAAGDDVFRELPVDASDIHEDLIVHVVGPDGRVVPGADVQTGFAPDARGDGRRLTIERNHLELGERFGSSGSRDPEDLDAVIRADDDGNARVRHDAPGAPRSALVGTQRLSCEFDAPIALTHFVEAASVDYPRTRVVYDPRRDREVTVRFPAPARLSVTVAGLPAHPDADQLRVVLRPKAGGEAVMQTYAGDGRFDFDPVVPGDYELTLTLAPRDENDTELSRQDLALVAGSRSVTIGIPLVTLTVAPPPGTTLDASSFVLVRVEGGRRRRAASEGTVRGESIVFRRLRAGTYCLSYWSQSASGEMTFDATADLALDWRPPAPNALRAEFGQDPHGTQDEGTPPGLSSGDLVVAVDGVPCWSNGDPLGGRSEGDEATLTVLHDGKETELRQMRPSRGWLRPATR